METLTAIWVLVFFVLLLILKAFSKPILKEPDYKRLGYRLTDPGTRQWVKKITETNFLVIENGEVFDIELNDFTHEELTMYITRYYDSLQQVEEIYGDDVNWIIAECIAEQSKA